MGKFGIGVRVVDSDGDAGVIVGKRKGEREVRYDELYGVQWRPKSELTVEVVEVEVATAWVPKVGDRVRHRLGDADVRAVDSNVLIEFDEPNGHTHQAYGDYEALLRRFQCAYFVCADELELVVAATPTKASGFKVGDRVRDWEGDLATVLAVNEHSETEDNLEVKYDKGQYPQGGTWFQFKSFTRVEPATIDDRADAGGGFKAGDRIRLIDGALDDMPLGTEVVAVAHKGGAAKTSVCYEDEPGNTTWRPGSYFELVKPLTIEAGKFCRTRDGRKVGPGRTDMFNIGSDSYGRKAALYFEDIGDVDANGVWLTGDGNADEDLVAEWVEPAAEPVAVAEVLFLKDGGTYVGASGAVHTVEANPDNSSWPFKTAGEPLKTSRFWRANGEAYNDDGWASWCDIGDPLVAEATPAPKFKVGDRVTITGTDELATVASRNSSGAMSLTYDWGNTGGEIWADGELAPPTTLTPGTRVTITGAGRVTARTGQHTHVVIDGAEPGANSFAIPTHLLAAE